MANWRGHYDQGAMALVQQLEGTWPRHAVGKSTDHLPEKGQLPVGVHVTEHHDTERGGYLAEKKMQTEEWCGLERRTYTGNLL